MGSLRPLAVGGVITVMLLSIGVLTTMRFAADSTPTPQAVPTQLSPASSDPSTEPPQASSAAGPPSARLAVPGGAQPPRPGPARPGEMSRAPSASTRGPGGDSGGTGDSGSDRARDYDRDFDGPDEPSPDRDQRDSHDRAEDRMTRQAADAICDRYNLPRESCERAASR
jgi:hypothetical protein